MRKVYIDCPELIPCNPCQFFCPTGAIFIGENITAKPEIELSKCTGCSKCVAACPGQACFVIDADYGKGIATIDFPYEYLPEPMLNSIVKAKDNEGKIICDGEILKIIKNKSNQQTSIIRLAVPKKLVYQIRGIGIYKED